MQEMSTSPQIHFWWTSCKLWNVSSTKLQFFERSLLTEWHFISLQEWSTKSWPDLVSRATSSWSSSLGLEALQTHITQSRVFLNISPSSLFSRWNPGLLSTSLAGAGHETRPDLPQSLMINFSFKFHKCTDYRLSTIKMPQVPWFTSPQIVHNYLSATDVRLVQSQNKTRLTYQLFNSCKIILPFS